MLDQWLKIVQIIFFELDFAHHHVNPGDSLLFFGVLFVGVLFVA